MIGPVPIRTPFFDGTAIAKSWIDFFSQLAGGGDVVQKRIIAGAILTPVAVSYWESPQKTKTEITKLTFTNFSAGSVNITVHLVPAGGTVADSNKLIVQAVAAGATFDCTVAEGHVLDAGGSIQALASVDAAVTIIGSGNLTQ